MSLFVGKIHCLRPSLPLNRTTPLKASSTEASPPNPHFSVADYLVQSCGLPSDEALRASLRIRHLESPNMPDSVLQFLRQSGMSESDIRTAVSQEPSLLCSCVESHWRPNVAKLQEIGFSLEDISGIMARCPRLFLSNFVPRVDFWLWVLGSADILSKVLRRCEPLLCCDLKNVIPKLTFLREECGLSATGIVQLIKAFPNLMLSRIEPWKMKVERVEEVGFPRSSGKFVYILIFAELKGKDTLDARLNNLKSLGFSEEQVRRMITAAFSVLYVPEEVVARKLEFLIKEAGCDMSYVMRHPDLLTHSLENRLIPRTVVRKLLMSKRLPEGKRAISYTMRITEKEFVDKFVLPFEDTIPGLRQAYADAFPGNIEVIE